MEQKGLQRILEIDHSLLQLEVLSDEQRLKQIFVNLISNALKFTFTGNIKVKAIVEEKVSSTNIMGISAGISTNNSDRKKGSDCSNDS